MNATTLMSKGMAAVLLVLLLAVGGFLAGGVYARLSIPPGQGLAGAGTAAILVLGGAALGALAGIIIALKAARIWRWTGGAAVFAVLAWVAVLVIPMRRLEIQPYEPPAVFEPEYVLSLMADPNPTGPRDDTLSLPFDRLDVTTRERRIRGLPRDSTVMCMAEMTDFEQFERVRAAAIVVRDQCASETGCTETTCRDCSHYLLMYMQAGDSTIWRDISSEYLAATAEGQTLVAELVRVYDGAQPWSYCTN
jgi:hypothetical protein